VKNYLLFFTAFLFSSFSTINGQNIQYSDLHGEWTMDTGRRGITLYFNFINESSYYYSSEKDTTSHRDYYELISKEHESVLTLYRNTGSYVASRKIYLIRKNDSVTFKLQIPETNQLGEIISYEWRDDDKKNTYTLYRLERRVEITN
jgi:hypothetical protein